MNKVSLCFKFSSNWLTLSMANTKQTLGDFCVEFVVIETQTNMLQLKKTGWHVSNSLK